MGLIPLVLPTWDPLAMLISYHLVLCPCRVTGTWSYWCHCHRLPLGHLCACGLGHHHAEKVLCLLNSINDFSVTHQPLAAPAARLPGLPGEARWQGCSKGTPASALGSRAAPSALCSWHMDLWGAHRPGRLNHSSRGHLRQ